VDMMHLRIGKFQFIVLVYLNLISEYLLLAHSSDGAVRQLFVESVAGSCKTRQISIESVIDLIGYIKEMDCRELILALIVNGSQTIRNNSCAICSADRNQRLMHDQVQSSEIRLNCTIIAELPANGQTSFPVNFSIRPARDWPNGVVSYSTTFDLSCMDSVQANNQAELPQAPVVPSELDWHAPHDLWTGMFWESYRRIAMSAMHLNTHPSPLQSDEDESLPELPLPVFVMNLPGRTDRRRHMEALLPALGFRSPVFPRVIAAADIDIEALVRAGRVSPGAVSNIAACRDKGPSTVPAYIAHALSVLDVLRDAVAAGLDWFLVAEDDLMPAAGPDEVLSLRD
jgi:hypothetical protein